MHKYHVQYVSFAGIAPKHGAKTVRANSARNAMDILEQQHPEFSTTCAKKVS